MSFLILFYCLSFQDSVNPFDPDRKQVDNPVHKVFLKKQQQQLDQIAKANQVKLTKSKRLSSERSGRIVSLKHEINFEAKLPKLFAFLTEVSKNNDFRMASFWVNSGYHEHKDKTRDYKGAITFRADFDGSKQESLSGSYIMEPSRIPELLSQIGAEMPNDSFLVQFSFNEGMISILGYANNPDEVTSMLRNMRPFRSFGNYKYEPEIPETLDNQKLFYFFGSYNP